MNVWIRFKSAITGLFVSKDYAEKHKETTYGSKVKRALKKKPKKPPVR